MAMHPFSETLQFSTVYLLIRDMITATLSGSQLNSQTATNSQINIFLFHEVYGARICEQMENSTIDSMSEDNSDGNTTEIEVELFPMTGWISKWESKILKFCKAVRSRM